MMDGSGPGSGPGSLLRRFPLLCALLLSLTGLTLLLHSYLHVLLLFWSFLAGAVTFFCAIGPETLFPNLLFPSRSRTKEAPESPLTCAVCGKIHCLRHGSTLRLENHQPWLHLKVHSQVDKSISEVFELVLENFVYPWYRDITDDESCVDELRVTFRFMASVLLRRAQKVDVLSVVTTKVIRATMKHLQVITQAGGKVRDVDQLQQVCLDLYGSDLHVAVRSLRLELQYLRTLLETLVPLVMPPKSSECRSLALLLREVMAGSVFLPTMDFLADPDTVNLMVLLFVDDAPPEPASGPASPLVPLLHRYADVGSRSSVLQVHLKQILQQQDLLFRFINFLKQQESVHVLQFSLALEDFNNKLLKEDQVQEDLQQLHQQLQLLLLTFCEDQSEDHVQLKPELLEHLRRISAGPYSSVLDLQICSSLFEAQEHVCFLLEQVFTPMFCHSDEYFRHLLRGSESWSRNCRLSRSAGRRGEVSGISRIGSRIKGVFRSGVLEAPPLSDADEDTVEEAAAVLEDDVHLDAPEIGPAGTTRNLSAWIVNIPYIEIYQDNTPVFCVYVERNDHTQVGHDSESWPVYRRYVEFYALESKLTEFHGVFPNTQLPSKRILGPKNLEFLTSKREEFEDYLQKLLQHPELSSSQLLFDFLSPHGLESQFVDRILPDVNLGKIFKSVPGRLVKERGQNLEPFIQNFFSSCESPRPKPSVPEVLLLNQSSQCDKIDSRNEASCLVDAAEQEVETRHFLYLTGLYDYMVLAGRLVFHFPDWLHHFLSTGRMLLKRTFEAHMEQILQTRLEQILQEHRLVSLITQLRDSVFCESSGARTPEDRRSRAERTLQEMRSFMPDLLTRLVGEDSVQRGVRLVFQGLQQPLLNKQMSYVLLDIVLQELFPELDPVRTRRALEQQNLS